MYLFRIEAMIRWTILKRAFRTSSPNSFIKLEEKDRCSCSSLIQSRHVARLNWRSFQCQVHKPAKAMLHVSWIWISSKKYKVFKLYCFTCSFFLQPSQNFQLTHQNVLWPSYHHRQIFVHSGRVLWICSLQYPCNYRVKWFRDLEGIFQEVFGNPNIYGEKRRVRSL